MSVDLADAITDRLNKAQGIAAMMRVAKLEHVTPFAIENSAWAIEGLLVEAGALVSGKENLNLPRTD
ncbi:hypothetical protein [Rhodanobacter sp. L36]|uniref:hypothetical protein n=1 Tax=Rhodanobacter sp. L36 TaxID=1747221 RepID=UPI00131DE474|nr:hypothetical protein [Rhodanobacter sp. L36]